MPDEEEKDKTSSSMAVGHVTIKMPEFMESSVKGWFQILEAQFTLKGVTVSATKFLHVLATLPAHIVTKLPENIVLSNKYELLKDAVLSIYEETKPELLDKLMSNSTLSGRPSVYLAEMLTVAARIGLNDTIVRHKFIQNLPDAIRPVIAAQQDLPTGQLGKLADNLLPYFNKQTNVLHVEETTPFSRNSNARVQNSNASGRNIPHGLRPYSQDQKPKVCRAHLYFAEKARTCKSWCKWPSKSGCNILPNSRPATPTGSRNSSPNRLGGAQ